MSADKGTFGPTDIVVDRRPDGTLLVRSPHELGPYPEKMTDRLDHWAQHASYRTFLAQRDANGRWRNVTYAEAQYFARRIAQALLNRGLSIQNPVVALSSNDIEHTLLELGAAYAGIPYVPLPPDYSLTSEDFGWLRYSLKLMTPGLIFAANGKSLERALAATMPEEAELVVNENPVGRATMFADLVNTEPTPAVDHAHSHVNGDTVLRITFTARQGQNPKGMVQTHRMWASNQAMARSFYRFLADEPPVLVAGMGNRGVVLYNGGSYYFDQNVRVIAPTMYWSMPQEMKMLIPRLRNDAAFRELFFRKLKVLNVFGAGIPQQIWDDLAEISAIPMTNATLCTIDTTPFFLFGLPYANRPDLVGVPAQGVEIKLVPNDRGKLDVRMKGPNVTWGYWRNLELTRAAFDEEGFFRLGESVRCVDAQDPAKGFIYDGLR